MDFSVYGESPVYRRDWIGALGCVVYVYYVERERENKF
jgi:hypothetical protein